MTETPATRAGRWLVDRSRWDDGMRGFFVRINASAGPDDMLQHVLAIEAEAARDAFPGAERLADILHETLCGPFATIDPQKCVGGRDRDVRLAAAILRRLAASPSRPLTETSATAYGSVNSEPRIDGHDVEHAGEQR